MNTQTQTQTQTKSNEFLEQCRAAMQAEQTQSLTETNNWAHVDRQQVHANWDVLYKTLAPMVDVHAPASDEIQNLMAQHYAIVSNFYVPSKLAYIGMSLFYAENPAMRDFHLAYHPKMVDFLQEAIWVYAQSINKTA
jgi:hypothetical protein